VGGDHQADQIEPGGAGDHRLDEPLVAGDIYDGDPALAEVEAGEAELGRDPARLLDREAIRVDAGQRQHQRGLAVIDVPGGTKDDRVRHAATLPRGGPTCRHARSRSSRLRILPVGLRGSSAMNVTRRGRLKSASWARQKSMTSASLTAWPSRTTTNACSVSPHSGSGTP